MPERATCQAPGLPGSAKHAFGKRTNLSGLQANQARTQEARLSVDYSQVLGSVLG